MSVPVWIQNLLDNPHLAVSFNEDMEHQKRLAEQEGFKWIERGDMAKAQMALGKVHVFRAMVFSLNSIIKEKEAQNVHIQSRGEKTGSSKSRK